MVAAGQAGPAVVGLPGEAVGLAGLVAAAGVSGAGVQDGGGRKQAHWQFLTNLEPSRIVQAIRDAESKTSGEIRVYVQRGKLAADPLIVAQKKFQRLGMYKTRERKAG